VIDRGGNMLLLPFQLSPAAPVLSVSSKAKQRLNTAICSMATIRSQRSVPMSFETALMPYCPPVPCQRQGRSQTH